MSATATGRSSTAAARSGRRHGRLRRGLRALSTVLIVAGALMILDAALTLLWQEPVTALYALIEQHELGGQLDRLEGGAPTPSQQAVLGQLPNDQARIGYLARDLQRTARAGEPIGRIFIPKIYGGKSFVVVQGTDTSSLMKGPGHYPDTPLPGLHGTVGIAGHRTTYLKPFRHIDELRPGDRIVVRMPYASFTYRVELSRVVLPTALGVTRRVDHDRLILSACTPLYSASHRLVVFARLTHVQARGAALRRGRRAAKRSAVRR